MYTGERILPGGVFTVTYQQSLKAYEYTKELARGKVVLDVACGEGYGTATLAQTAREVVGVDRDSHAIAQARAKYSSPTITFRQGDLHDLPKLLGKQFEIVCCFQTIEHTRDHDQFLRTLKALTLPGGKIIVTTPNREMFPTFNPYHVHELNVAELQALCERHFSKFIISGVIGSPAVIAYRESKARIGQLILRLDVLNVRSHLPRRVLEGLYSFISFYIIKGLSFWKHRQAVQQITLSDFQMTRDELNQALDLIVVAEV